MLIVKSIVYRILRILLLLVTALVVLGDIKTAISISFIDAIVATIYYYYFDKIWEKFGIPFFTKVWYNIKYSKLNRLK
jgi:uncharacterized membrane protein